MCVFRSARWHGLLEDRNSTGFTIRVYPSISIAISLPTFPYGTLFLALTTIPSGESIRRPAFPEPGLRAFGHCQFTRLFDGDDVLRSACDRPDSATDDLVKLPNQLAERCVHQRL
jgi:hypothetical protein